MLDQWRKRQKRAGNIYIQSIYLQWRGKVYGTVNVVLYYIQQGTARNLWGAAKGKQSYKSRHRAELSRYNFYNLNVN